MVDLSRLSMFDAGAHSELKTAILLEVFIDLIGILSYIYLGGFEPQN